MPYQRLLGNQLHQPFYGGIRFPIRAAFKVFPQGNQGDDHGRRFKIQLHSLHTETLPHPRYQQIQPIQKSGAGTDGDQGIHIGRQRHKLPHAVYQIMPVQPQDGARQNALCPPIHPEPPTPFRDGPVPHGAHGQIHQRNQQQNGPNETGAARFLLFQPFLPLRSGKRLLLPVRQVEAGFLHHRSYPLHGGGIRFFKQDGHLPRQQIQLYALHPLQSFHGALHLGGTPGAMHTGNKIVLFFHCH